MNTSNSTNSDYFYIPITTNTIKNIGYTYNDINSIYYTYDDTITYQPFVQDYVYSTSFSWQIDDTTSGWKNYMFSNCIRSKVVNILLSLYQPYTNNNFERHLYKIVYDLIYDMTVKKGVIFNSFFRYDKNDIQKYIELIIKDYHSYFKEDV